MEDPELPHQPKFAPSTDDDTSGPGLSSSSAKIFAFFNNFFVSFELSSEKKILITFTVIILSTFFIFFYASYKRKEATLLKKLKTHRDREEKGTENVKENVNESLEKAPMNYDVVHESSSRLRKIGDDFSEKIKTKEIPSVYLPSKSFGSASEFISKDFIESKPIDSLEELLGWFPYHDEDKYPNSNISQLKPNSLKRKLSYFAKAVHTPKIKYSAPPRENYWYSGSKSHFLVCHDFKNNYKSDRYVQGFLGQTALYKDSWRFYHWPSIDIFIYFSHHFITIPPVQWINVAHKNNVRILGTFITEWNDGKNLCKQIFSSKKKVEMVADQLIALAGEYEFEGWLINIENDIDWTDGVELFLHFLLYLKENLKSRLSPDHIVLFYDSVTVDGILKWQDGLTHKNIGFFEASDGIFTNYTWKEGAPSRSALLATSIPKSEISNNTNISSLSSNINSTNIDNKLDYKSYQNNRRFDVFMGIDVYGRNTYGGGGYECSEAINVIRNAAVSVALFGPGWVWENELKIDQNQPFSFPEYLPVEDQFNKLNTTFWNKITDRMWPPRRFPSSLSKPFISNFNTGVGHIQGVGSLGFTKMSPKSFIPSSSSSSSSFNDIVNILSDKPQNDIPIKYNLSQQDYLPIILLQKNPIAEIKESSQVDEDNKTPKSLVSASISYTLPPYRGSSSFIMFGFLKSGARASVPLYHCDIATSVQVLELKATFRLPSLIENDIIFEVKVKGKNRDGSTKELTLVLKGNTEESDRHNGSTNESPSKGQKFQAKKRSARLSPKLAKSRDKVFYGPAYEYVDADIYDHGLSKQNPFEDKSLFIKEAQIQNGNTVNSLLDKVKDLRAKGLEYSDISKELKNQNSKIPTSIRKESTEGTKRNNVDLNTNNLNLVSLFPHETLFDLRKTPWVTRVFRIPHLKLEGDKIWEINCILLKKMNPKNKRTSINEAYPVFAQLGSLVLNHGVSEIHAKRSIMRYNDHNTLEKSLSTDWSFDAHIENVHVHFTKFEKLKTNLIFINAIIEWEWNMENLIIEGNQIKGTEVFVESGDGKLEYLGEATSMPSSTSKDRTTKESTNISRLKQIYFLSVKLEPKDFVQSTKKRINDGKDESIENSTQFFVNIHFIPVDKYNNFPWEHNKNHIRLCLPEKNQASNEN